MSQITKIRIILTGLIIGMLSIGCVCGMAAADESSENITVNVSEVATVEVIEADTTTSTTEAETASAATSDPLAKLQAAIEAANAKAAEDYAALTESLQNAESVNANISAAIAEISAVSEQAAKDKAALDAALSGSSANEETAEVPVNETA